MDESKVNNCFKTVIVYCEEGFDENMVPMGKVEEVTSAISGMFIYCDHRYNEVTKSVTPQIAGMYKGKVLMDTMGFIIMMDDVLFHFLQNGRNDPIEKGILHVLHSYIQGRMKEYFFGSGYHTNS